MIDQYLNQYQIQYVFYHLNHTFDISWFLTNNSFDFIRDKNSENKTNSKIIFNLSNQEINFETINSYENIPILFPLNTCNEIYSVQSRSIIFNHDILKSAFYLLSGYQETIAEERDIFDRYRHEVSIQEKLNITNTPVVNYYFEWIGEGLKKYCELNGLSIEKRNIFTPFAVHLTHDIDKLNFHTINRVLYKIKELTGLVTPTTSKTKLFKQIAVSLFEILKFSKKKNPSWDFEKLRNTEKSHGYKSDFFFLPKDIKNQDSDYTFKEERLKDLFSFLKSEDCEIGLHGTVKSAKDTEQLLKTKNELEHYAKVQTNGIRQHRLIYYHPQTLHHQEDAGFIYDTTIGFAEHEGFRNSYCLPFKAFDFNTNKMFNIWEIPLILMDVTVFLYRDLKSNEVLKKVEELVLEIKKFNGVFTLLWHNGFPDEDRFPGSSYAYKQILDIINSHQGISFCGMEIVEQMNQITNHVSQN
jgi:Family of unknown function (DUF7033)